MGLWLLPAILGVAVVAYPILIAPTKPVLMIALGALVLGAFGIVVRSTSVVIAAAGLALGQYALALWLSGGPLRLAGAALFGVGLVLLVETADFDRRARDAALGPGLVVSQMRYWAIFAALAGPAALVVVWLATAASVVVSMPWSPAFAACGAAAALVAVTVALRRSRG